MTNYIVSSIAMVMQSKYYTTVGYISITLEQITQ